MKTINTITLFLLLLLSGGLTFAQTGGGCYAGTVIAPPQPFGLGQPAPGAIVRVCSSTATGSICSPLTPGGIFSDPGLLNPISNPFTADQNGNYNFCASNGNYLVQTFPQPGTTYSFQATVGIAPSGSYTFSGNNIFTGTNQFSGIELSNTLCTGALAGFSVLCATSAGPEVSINGVGFVFIPTIAGDIGGTSSSPTVTSAHITGGTVNTIPKFNATGNPVPSACTDNASTVACTEPISSTGGVSGTTGTFTQITNTGDTLLSSGKVISWNSDTGISRDSAGAIDIGSGTQGSKTGTVKATRYADASAGPATIGLVSGANNTILVAARNAAGNGNIAAVQVNSSDLVTLGSGPFQIPAVGDTAVGKATTDTLTNKTLTAPVINGTPTGTGIPTVTKKIGTGAGNYTTSSTSFVRVDTTNLAFTVTIPTGWALEIKSTGTVSSATGVGGVNVALADGSADNTGILIQAVTTPNTAGAATFIPFFLLWTIAGDGASHTINLQFDTGNAADAAIIVNNTSTLKPVMTFLLTPSN